MVHFHVDNVDLIDRIFDVSGNVFQAERDLIHEEAKPASTSRFHQQDSLKWHAQLYMVPALKAFAEQPRSNKCMMHLD